MTTRSASPARFGVGAGLQPRLEMLGWIEQGAVTTAAEPLLRTVRAGSDPEATLQRLLTLAERSRIDLTGPEGVELAPLAAASRSLWESLVRHPEWREENASRPDEDPRLLVQRRTIEISLNDLHRRWDLDQVVAALSDLADEAVNLALQGAFQRLRGRHPEVDEVRFAVIALGKWGGRELNYASDIDLVFVYEPVELESEAGRVAALRVATSLIDRLATPTAEGIAFRVDTDLRPEGGTGPLVRTLEGYRAYYERWGEAWEFQALLKARPAAGDLDLGGRFVEMAAGFVWPSELDPDAVRDLRRLKARAEEAAEPADIKRAPGGIRDVEFSVQLLQLVHGRADPTLRIPGTVAALSQLAAGDYVRGEDAAALADSYRFLRMVEHRIQMYAMAQTHRIPADREQLALAIGYRAGETSAAEQFNAELNHHRSRVRRLHEDLYYRPLLEAFTSSSVMGLSRQRAEQRLEALGFLDVGAAAQAFEGLTAGLSRRSRLMQQLLPLMVDWLSDTPNPDLGLHQLAMLVASSPDQVELTGILRDRPVAAQRLCLLLGSSRLMSSFLDRIPEFLARLADDRLLVDLPVGEKVAATARERMQLRTTHEARMASLRRLVRRRMLRVAAADLLDLVDGDRVRSALTDTADAAAAAALWTAEQQTGAVPMAVVAMGKWGGRELGYGSDLDLIYVTEPGDNQTGLRLAGEFAAVLGQFTQEGIAYRIDPALRPEGKQGALARSLDAYQAYYQTRAEPWERLALIKARAVTGDEQLSGAFEDIRIAAAFPSAVPVEMVRSIRSIKARVEGERLPRGEDPEFHLKLGKGGLSDIEFLAQLWQLRLGNVHPELQTTGTVTALGHLATLGVITGGEAEHLSATYRLCTRLRNRLFLQTGRAHDALPIDGAELARLAMSLGYENRSALREQYRSMTRRSRSIFERKFFES